MSYIDDTFLAYALDRPVEKRRIEDSLERVRAHYAELYADPLTGRSHVTRAWGWRSGAGRIRAWRVCFVEHARRLSAALSR